MQNSAVNPVVNVYLTGSLGTAVILSVMTGRILERLGFTDALIRISLSCKNNENYPHHLPAIYNILGDINAAEELPSCSQKSWSHKGRTKIAIATMFQSQQSFSTFMLGLVAFANAGIWAFPIVIIGVFLPVVVVPFLLSKTIYRDVKYKDISEMPRFTPSTPIVPTIFNGAREGAELMFLLLIPAVVVVYAIIGLLTYMGIWPAIQSAMSSFLSALSIDPETGMQSILVSPTLAMNTLTETIVNMPPRFAIGSFILPHQVCLCKFPLPKFLLFGLKLQTFPQAKPCRQQSSA